MRTLYRLSTWGDLPFCARYRARQRTGSRRLHLPTRRPPATPGVAFLTLPGRPPPRNITSVPVGEDKKNKGYR